MKKFTTLLALAMVANSGYLYAQYASDALRFSQGNYGSSSRFKGLGNAQISLGGDISSIGGNPAGLGMFTRSEFSITPEFNNTQADAMYLGQASDASHNRLNLAQAGIVWYNPVVKRAGSDVTKGALSFVWGIGYNRNNDLAARYNFNGVNSNNSIGQFFAEDANLDNAIPADLPEGTVGRMAYDNFLIDRTNPNSTQYRSVTGVGNDQSYNQVRYGSTSEINFAGAVNISNQLYIGASLGLVNMRYGYDSQFSEFGTNTSNDADNDMAGRQYEVSYRQRQITDGTGINGRIGVIVKPTDAVRIGATFQTPTWIHMEDVSSEVVDAYYGETSYTNDPSNYVFQYNLRTPYKASAGISAVLGTNALISADVDYIDYSSIKFSSTVDYYDPTTISNNNADVKDFYRSAVNYRVGAEYKLDLFAIRAGFGINGTPYEDDKSSKNFETKYYSAGLGYRFNQFYADLAYQRVETNSTLSPYLLNDFSEPVATAKLNKNNVFLTFGVRF